MGLGQRIGWMNGLLAVALCGAVACSGDPVGPETPPPGANDPAEQLGKGAGYRVAWATADQNTVLGLADLDAKTRLGRLDMLKKGQEPVVLSPETDRNVKVSLGSSPKALFMESVEDGLAGTLILADLTDGSKSAVPDGGSVAVEGFWFGPDSGSLVFLSMPVDGPVTRSTLNWSDGKSTKALGDGAALEGVLFSKDKTALVVGVEVDVAGVGQLLYVDMKTGEASLIAEDVQVVAAKSAAFAMDDAGKRVVFHSGDGLVQMWDSDGSLNDIGEAGTAVGVSPDGRMVGWVAGGKVIVSGLGGETTTVEGADATVLKAQRPLRFSHDNSYVYWFSGGVESAYDFVADVWVGSTKLDVPAVKVAKSVSVDTFHFSTKSPRISAVINLRTAQGHIDAKARGAFGFGAPDAELPSAALSSDPEATAAVYAVDAVVLPESERIVYLEAGRPGSKVGEVFVSGDKPGDEPVALGANVMIGSMRVAPEAFDRVIYTVQSETTGKGSRAIEDGTLHGALYGTTVTGPPKFLADGVIFLDITPAGRALAVVGQGENAGIWTYPLAF